MNQKPKWTGGGIFLLVVLILWILFPFIVAGCVSVGGGGSDEMIVAWIIVAALCYIPLIKLWSYFR